MSVSEIRELRLAEFERCMVRASCVLGKYLAAEERSIRIGGACCTKRLRKKRFMKIYHDSTMAKVASRRATGKAW